MYDDLASLRQFFSIKDSSRDPLKVIREQRNLLAKLRKGSLAQGKLVRAIVGRNL